MEDPSGYKCNTSISLDRTWYLPGDHVRGQCYVHCYSDIADKKPAPLKPLVVRENDNFFCPDPASLVNEDGEKAILVHAVSIVVESCCHWNAKLFSIQWGAGAGRGDALSDCTEAADTRGGVLAALLPSRRASSRVLFRTPTWNLLPGASLGNGEWTAVAFSFRLPEHFAPTLSGDVCQLLTTMHVTTSWRVRRGKASSTVQTGSFDVPVRVMVAPSAVPILLAAATPLTNPGSPLVVRNNEFSSTVLPSVPSQKLIPPAWSAARERVATQTDEGYLAFKAAQRERYHALVSERFPAQYRVVIPGSSTEVHVRLPSTEVCLGQTLVAYLAVVSSDSGRSNDAANAMLPPEGHGVVLKVEATMEQSECCLVASTSESQDTLEDDKTLRCLRTSVMDRQDCTIAEGTESVFKFFVCDHYDPTIATDIVSNVWRLRMLFVCTSRAYTSRECPRGFPVLLSSPELAIPLTVVPPALSEHASVGQVFA